MLITFFFLMVVPIVSKVRNHESDIAANFIVFISVIEPIAMIVLFIEWANVNYNKTSFKQVSRSKN